jgi:hypothetical protein
MFSPLVFPEIVFGSVLVDIRPLDLQLGLDWVQGLGIEGQGGVAVLGTMAVPSGRPDAVNCPSVFNYKLYSLLLIENTVTKMGFFIY